MQIEYCGLCGTRIDGQDLDEARAVRTTDLMCAKCREKHLSKGSGSHPGNRLIAPQRTPPVQRRISSTRAAVRPLRYQAPPRTSANPFLILTALLISGALALVLYTAWHAGPEEVQPGQASSSEASAQGREHLAAQTYERLIQFDGLKADDHLTRVQYLEAFRQKHEGTEAAAKAGLLIQALQESGPKSMYRINCGGNAVQPFLSDAFYHQGEAFTSPEAVVLTGVKSPAPMTAYQSERFGDFTYTFENLVPGQTYLVRLHFAEVCYTTAKARVFNVRMNGTEMLKAFDVFAATGGKNRAIVREEYCSADSAGRIHIEFQPVTERPKCSAIEIMHLGTRPFPAAPGRNPAVPTGATAPKAGSTPEPAPSVSVSGAKRGVPSLT